MPWGVGKDGGPCSAPVLLPPVLALAALSQNLRAPRCPGQAGSWQTGHKQMENHREDPKSLPGARKGTQEPAPSPSAVPLGYKGCFPPSSGGKTQPAAPVNFATKCLIPPGPLGKLSPCSHGWGSRVGKGLCSGTEVTALCNSFVDKRLCISLGWAFLVFPFFFFLHVFQFVL